MKANGFKIVERASQKDEAELSYNDSQRFESGQAAGRMAKFVHFVEEWTQRGVTKRRWKAFFARIGQEETGPYYVRRADNFRLTQW